MFKPKGVIILTLIILMTLSCSGPESDQPLLTAEIPLHLEEHIKNARIVGSEVPADLPAPIEWRFDEPQPDWKPAGPIFSEKGVVRLETTEDALRIHFSDKANRTQHSKMINGAIYIDLPDWRREEWSEVVVSARSTDVFRRCHLDFNLGERKQPLSGYRSAILFPGDSTPLISDGNIHTYKLRVDVHNEEWGRWENPWKQLVLSFDGPDPASIDILSVSVIPKEHIFADAPLGVKTVKRNKTHRRTLYTHAQGHIEYTIMVPEAGRLDFGAGVIKEDSPVTFRVIASQKDEKVTLFKETYADPNEWL